MPRSALRRAAVVGLAIVCFAPHAATSAEPQPPLTAAQQERRKERDRLFENAKKVYAAGDGANAIAAAQKMLAIDRELYGNVDDDVAGGLAWLADMHEDRDEFPAARKARDEVLTIRIKQHGPDHVLVEDARRRLAHLDRLERMNPDQRRQLARANQLISRVRELSDAGKYREALLPAEQSLELRRSVLGEGHWLLASPLHWQGMMYSHLGDGSRAETAYTQALAIRKQTIGEKHPEFAATLESLANVYSDRGDEAKAEPMRLQSLAVTKEAFGANSLSYATSLHNLSFTYKERKDYARAEALLKEALQIKKDLVGEQHRDYVSSLKALANLYVAMHDYARSESLFRQSLELERAVLGETHPDYASTLNNMAFVYKAVGDYARAAAQFRQALAILRASVGERHPHYVITVDNLADLYMHAGQYDKAEPLYRQAVDLNKQSLGDKHPAYIRSLHQLAFVYQNSEQYAKAEAAYTEVLAIRKKTVGPEDRDYLITLNNLAILYGDQGRYDRAEPLFRQVAHTQKKVLGPDAPDYRRSLSNLADDLRNQAEAAEQRDAFAVARKARQEVLDLMIERWGKDHWQVTDARLALENTGRLEALDIPQRERVRSAERLLKQADELDRAGKPADALPLARQAACACAAVLGQKNRLRGDCLFWLGHLNREIGQLNQAEALLTEAFAVRKEVLGQKHPDTIKTLNNLGFLFGKKKEYAKAAAAYREALGLRKDMLGLQHPDYATSVNNLTVTLGEFARYGQKRDDFATARKCYDEALQVLIEFRGEKYWVVTDARLDRAFVDDLERLTPEQRRRFEESAQLQNKIDELKQQGRSREALPLALRLVEMRKELFGDKHRLYFSALSRLALPYKETGDFIRAEPLYRQVLEFAHQTLGEKHPDYITDLYNLAGLYDAMGAHARAEPLLRQVVALRKDVLGENSQPYAAVLNDLAYNCGLRGDVGQELFLYSQAAAIKKRLLGSRHPDYAHAIANLGVCYDSLGDHVRAEALLREASDIFRRAGRPEAEHYAWTLRSLAALHRDLGNYSQAEALFRQSLDIYAEVLGKKDSTYAGTLESLGRLYIARGDFARAQPILEEAVQTQKEVLGERHPEYATAIQALAWLLRARGEYGRSEALYRQALDIRRQVGGENDVKYASGLRELAQLYTTMRDYARAEPLLRQALAIKKQALGEANPDYAILLAETGGLYQSMGDYARAEPLFRQAIEIQKKVIGENHVDYATSLNNLALLYADQNDFARAEPLYRQSMAITKAVVGEKDPSYARAAGNVASIYSSKGDYAAAESLYRQILELYRTIYGEKHPQCALMLYHLGWVHYRKGEFQDAERMLSQALAIYEAALGEQDPECAKCVQELAEVCAAQGQYDKAEALARRGLEIDRRHLEQTAGVQSERQQLATIQASRYRLDLYLSVALRSQAGVVPAYEHVLAWKGAVSGRQHDIRLLRRTMQGEGKPETAKLFDDLTTVTGRLATLSRATPDPDEPGKLVRDLSNASREVERLETALASASAAFRAQHQRRLTGRDIRAALPPGTVLVDLLDYYSFNPNRPKEDRRHRHFLAFVVRPDDPRVNAIDLGPVEPIHAAVTEWRRTFGRPTAEGRDPGAELGRLLWEPLREAVGGAKTVLISPDGTLAKVPWAALPGREPGTYLIEEVGLAVVPVPAQLPAMLGGQSRPPIKPSLLLVGDVRFDGFNLPAVNDRGLNETSRGGAPFRWPGLPGTRGEVEAIKSAFRNRFPEALADDLRQDDATEAAVRREAPHHRFLHFATHGYFAPPQLRSALAAVSRSAAAGDGSLFGRQDVAGFHPGLLSGLVLAGANHPLALAQDDGILTALDVQALDLDNVELATLSACETGLGESAAGEGLLGLQRAFQTAGARAVVAGLWKVDDAATQALMTEFYTRLWDGKHGKLEALREAQLALLRNYDPVAGRLRGVGGVAADEQPRAAGGKLPPFYWAAFVLSGDWR